MAIRRNAFISRRDLYLTLVYSIEQSSVYYMKTMIIKVTVPDEVDIHDVFVNMTADFYYNNRSTDDIGPHMDQIVWEIVSVDEERLAQ